MCGQLGTDEANILAARGDEEAWQLGKPSISIVSFAAGWPRRMTTT
jgi:hypothetical protein